MTMPSVKPVGINTICNDNKKASKPLIEKRRRARINSSLAELKTIVVGTENSSLSTTTRPPKLEKADILEMTVAFVKNRLQTKQITPSRDPNEYSIGYEYCLKEVCQFLEEEGQLNTKSRLLMHIHSIQPVSNNAEPSNTPTDDSMSCSSNSRSHTPSTVSTDNCQMEYSSNSPFTDTEQEVPSTSSSDKRTFPTDRSELGMDSRHSMEQLMPSPNSYQDTTSGGFSGPLNLAITPKRVQKDDTAVPRHSSVNQILQSRWPTVHYGKYGFPTQVVTYDCGHEVQEPHLVQSHDFQGQVEFACCSSCVWRPW